jgi:type I restriction enzyme M protein
MSMTSTNANNTRDLERTLWANADKLRGHLTAAEYKHIVLALIFITWQSNCAVIGINSLET